MKYGVIVFKNTENIGDDIQSYAAMKLLPNVDYYIEREEMDLFLPKNQEIVNVLMNGWFMHNKYSFLPSPFINPIFISTHFSSYDTWGIGNEYIDCYSDYLKEHEPIGCRDLHTQNLLDSYGIKNYFSGCVTLTIDKFKSMPKTEEQYICCVDVDDSVYQKMLDDGRYIVKKISHKVDVKKNSKLTWKKRFENVENLLKEYQGAWLVITSRLHCALPCLALGVPVLLVKKKDSKYYDDRLSTFLEYLNFFTVDEFLDCDVDKIYSYENSSSFKKIAESLKKNVKGCLSSDVSGVSIPSIEEYNSLYVDRKKKLNIMFESLSNSYNKLVSKNTEFSFSVAYWKKQYNDLLIEKDKAVTINDDYWKKEYNDLLNLKDLAIKQNDEYWKKEFNELLDKYRVLENTKISLEEELKNISN